MNSAQIVCADYVHVFSVDFSRVFLPLSQGISTQEKPLPLLLSAQQWLPWRRHRGTSHSPEGAQREGGKVALQDVRAQQNRFSQCDKISTAASIGTAFRLNPFKPHVHHELTVQQRRVERKTTRVARHQLRQLQHASIT